MNATATPSDRGVPMLAGFGSGDGSGRRRGEPPGHARLPGDDPRLRAFRDLIGAADRRDTPAMLAAMRDLRRLGWSCCMTSNRPGA